MNTVLLLRACHYPADRFHWCHWRLNQPASLEQGEVAAAELCTLQLHAQNALVILAIPGEQVRSAQVSLPNRKRDLLASLPFLIEEQLSTPIEQFQVASGAWLDDGVEVFALERAHLDYWQQQLDEAGLSAPVITADYQLLPHSTDGLIIQLGQRYLCRLPHWQASVSAPTFTALAAQQPLPPPQPWDQQQLDTHVAQQFSLKQLPVNLLQGDYRHQHPWLRYWSLLRAPLGAAALAALLLLAIVGLDNQAKQRQIDQLDQAMTQLYRHYFPDARRITNPVRQLKAQLRTQSGYTGSHLLDWLAQLSDPLQREQLHLVNLRYSATPSTLRLQLSAADYRAFEQLSRQLQQAGLNAELGTLSKQGNGVAGLLTIQETTP